MDNEAIKSEWLKTNKISKWQTMRLENERSKQINSPIGRIIKELISEELKKRTTPN